MIALLKRYRELLVVAALLAAPLVVYFAHAKRTDDRNRFDRAVVAGTAPIERLVGWTVTGVLNGWRGYVALRGAHEQAAGLLRQNRELSLEVVRLQEVQRENERLEKLLSMAEAPPERKYIAARVVGVRLDPKGMQTVTLDRGTADGIQKGMPVVVTEGAVGRVNDAYAHSADVLILTDRNSSVAVRVERSRARANVRGLGVTDRCRLDYALRVDDMIEGDELVTAGTDGVFPRGIRVGKVTHIRRAGQSLYQLADVVPAVDITKLEEVLVVTQQEKGEGEPAAAQLPVPKPDPQQ